MIAPPVLLGVDVVEVDRVSRAMAYSGQAYTDHVTAPDERPLHDDPELATAACVAIKECLIKAVGGRAPGFSWHDFSAAGDAADDDRDWAGPLLEQAVPELSATTDVALTRSCTYTVRGASAAAALARFALGTTGVVGTARWGWRGNLVVALAILTPQTEGTC